MIHGWGTSHLAERKELGEVVQNGRHLQAEVGASRGLLIKSGLFQGRWGSIKQMTSLELTR